MAPVTLFRHYTLHDSTAMLTTPRCHCAAAYYAMLTRRCFHYACHDAAVIIFDADISRATPLRQRRYATMRCYAAMPLLKLLLRAVDTLSPT